MAKRTAKPVTVPLMLRIDADLDSTLRRETIKRRKEHPGENVSRSSVARALIYKGLEK